MLAQKSKPKSLWKSGLLGAFVGVLGGTGYYWYYVEKARKEISLVGTELEITKLKHKPPVTVNRQVVYPVDSSGLKLTLFQYQTCPFCCKVRTFLDYYGISYDVVEVNPVLRGQISWSQYKKVPIILAKSGNGYQPLQDSTMIISLLGSHLYDREHQIDDLIQYYPNVGMRDEEGNFKYEILNRYFLMFRNGVPKNRKMEDLAVERRWRKWADEVLVHTLSPNVYRTLDEAYDTFQWFSQVGKWEEYFPTWERWLVINVGAIAMWLIAKRLKQRHGLKDEVRLSLYDEINYWMSAIRKRGGQFMGGSTPDLSDLAVYGILKSIEGCKAFKDALENTKLSTWYEAMTAEIENNSGSKFVATA